MNTNTSLIVNNPTAVSLLVNKDLRKNVSAMIQASSGLNKSAWKYAIAVHNIIAGELFKDDFKTQKAFAKAMDTGESTLTKFYNAVECVTNVLGTYGYSMENISYSNAYLLSTIKDLDEFMKLHDGADFSKMGKNQLEKLISAFKHPEKEVVEPEPQEAETEETETPQEEKQELKKGDIVAHIENGFLSFTYRKKSYVVPMKEIKGYILEDEEQEQE